MAVPCQLSENLLKGPTMLKVRNSFNLRDQEAEPLFILLRKIKVKTDQPNDC